MFEIPTPLLATTFQLLLLFITEIPPREVHYLEVNLLSNTDSSVYASSISRLIPYWIRCLSLELLSLSQWTTYKQTLNGILFGLCINWFNWWKSHTRVTISPFADHLRKLAWRKWTSNCTFKCTKLGIERDGWVRDCSLSASKVQLSWQERVKRYQERIYKTVLGVLLGWEEVSDFPSQQFNKK